jgi:hypothetical protein
VATREVIVVGMLMLERFTVGLLVLTLGSPAAGCGDDAAPSDSERDAQAADSGNPTELDAASERDPDSAAGERDAAASDAGEQPASDASATDAGARLDAGTDAAAGAAGPQVDRREPKLHELSLDPKLLDPSTSDSLSPQFAQLDTRVAARGLLVIFLPGANNVPRDWRDHGRKLAEYGFHVLIPHYNNRWSSNDTCAGQDSSCGDNTRWEALVGEDTSKAIAIARADSAEGRVVTMLKHLGGAQPEGDWGYYLTATGELDYAKSIIAGISHGAASAGMYAARRPFTRNVMHASGPAGSAKAEKMTPVSRWYGFVHTADPAYAAITSAWNNFALPGAVRSIDGQAPPFGGSQRLSSSAMSSYPHGSVCVHSSSPKDASGKYLFEAAWRYLYGVEP